ncbi:DUF4905 domain-containing protein [Rosettibacter firmus]|uniref:DUF4905 domain-containing protein n=1 Tax=Rosettibacter firmus TaxID=3111522 RepID=UPI00336BC6C7
MKAKKYYKVDYPNQIWRLLISDKDKLIIETRNPETKEAFFNCFDINNKKVLFDNFQLEEKYYVGIETVHNEIIYFHKFPKPDLPNHKEIIAFDINSQKILWINDELSFLFAFEDKIFAFKQGFEERYFYALNYFDGNLVDDFGNDYLKINSLRKKAEEQKDYSNYIFPQVYYKDDNQISEIIDYLIKKNITGNIEFNLYKKILLLSFHLTNNDNNLSNHFIAFDLEKEKIIISEILNKNTKSFMTDSFFMYKNFLILLKEKNGLIIYKLE